MNKKIDTSRFLKLGSLPAQNSPAEDVGSAAPAIEPDSQIRAVQGASPAEPNISDKVEQPISESRKAAEPAKKEPSLLSQEAKEERQQVRVRQHEGSVRLAALKKQKRREMMRMLNVPLTDSLYQRLKRASTENEVSMAAIMVTAIDGYLQQEGY